MLRRIVTAPYSHLLAKLCDPIYNLSRIACQLRRRKMRLSAFKILSFSTVLLLGALALGNSEVVVLAQTECTITLQPSQSIQRAIERAPAGAVICLGREGGALPRAAESWKANLLIGKSLTLRGLHPELTRIEAQHQALPVIRIESAEPIEVTLDDLTVAGARLSDGFQVRGRAAVRLTRVRILHNEFNGMALADAATAQLSEVQLSDNLLSGLALSGEAQAQLTDAQLSGNGLNGLSLGDSTSVRLTNAQLFANGFDGLWIGGRARAALFQSRIFANFIAGLQVGGQAQVSLSDSDLSRNRNAGLAAGGQAQVRLKSSQLNRNGLVGLAGKDAARVELSHVQFSGNFNGLSLRDSAQANIQASSIQNNSFCGFDVLSPQAKLGGSPNLMSGNGADLCGFAPALVRKPLTPQTQRTQLQVPGDYDSLQEAIDAIAPGGTIHIGAGSYPVGLTIWKPLTLQGVGTPQTAFKPLPGRQLVGSITAEGQGVRLEKLAITGFLHGALVGLSLYGASELRNVQVLGSFSAGLSIGGSAKVSLTSVQVLTNGFGGILVGGAAQVNLSNCQVSGTLIYALRIRGTATMSLNNCRLASSIGTGLWLGGLTQVTINNAKLSGAVGALVIGGATLAIIQNAQLSSRADGLDVGDTAQVTLESSEIAHSSDGLAVGGAAQVRLLGNSIHDNDRFGITANSPDNIAECRGNKLSKNGADYNLAAAQACR
ncbi:MAG TPA: hypothetical protein ENI60_07255 [Candidatus Fraserbacteria bacterium]|nr:hypothetical protein [Candidatus Fraserbacteria bacterium]